LELAYHTCEFFKEKKDKVEVDELEDNFAYYFADQLDVEVEDGSLIQVAQACIQLYKQVIERGVFDDVELLRREAATRSSNPASFNQVLTEDAYNDLDDDQVNEPLTSHANVIPEEPSSEPQEPAVDADGFELVTRRRRRWK
jgi:hypothetical protein